MSFRKETLQADVLQLNPVTPPPQGRSNAPTTGGLYFDASTNQFLGIINGQTTPLGGAVVFAGTPTGTCSPNQIAVNSGTGALYSCSGGSWVQIGPTAGSLVSPVTSPNPLAFDINVAFKGPTPYTDVTRYGVRAVNNGVAPAIPGITATINSSSTSAAISAASTFQNGDGVTIFGAGSANTVTTPTGLTVTPSTAAGPTGTGIDVPSIAGATQYCYAILAQDKAGGLSAATSQVCTSTGVSSLGFQSLAIITGFTRSGQTVTATASSPHGLSTGAWVNITTSNAFDNLYFGGWYNVSVTDTTHFTYLTGNAVSSGAPAISNGGGTINYWYDNKLAWTSQPNAFRYYIYGGPSGSLTLLGVSNVQTTINGLTPNTTFQDFGSTLMGGQNFPYWVPTTPPVAALADPLVTTIVSGASTTTLTLANAASTSVSGATILFDNAPNILTAASHTSFNSLLYFPAGSYVTNSYLNLSPYSVAISLAGSALFLNDTMELNSGSKIFGKLEAQTVSALSFGYSIGGTVQAGRANPAVYAGFGVKEINGIEFSAQGNAVISLLEDNAANTSLAYVNFSANGLMAQPLVIRAADFLVTLDHVALVAAQTAGTSTPLFNYTGGNIDMTNISMSGRGIFYTVVQAGANVQIGGASRNQGIVMPLFSMNTLGSGATGGTITFNSIELDTASENMFASLTQPSNGSYSGTLTILNGGAGGPSGGYGYVTGAPVGLAIGLATIGQNINSYSDFNFGNNFVTTLGAGQIGYQFSAPSAPSTAVSAGGSVPVGTFSYAVTFVDATGKESPIGAYVNFTTTNGNQTVTVTPPAQVAGASFWKPYRCNANGLNCSLANIAGCTTNAGISFASTFVDTFGFGCNTQPLVGGSVASLSSSGLAGAQITLAAVLFANLGTPRNGTFVFCPDCTVANPCAGSGTGAFAKRLNGIWVCN